MQASVKKSILNNLTLKVVSFIIAYGFWHIASQARPIDIWLDVPVCFYTVPRAFTLDAPEKIRINLSGRRVDLYGLDTKNLGVHINGATLHAGANMVEISNRTLFLPERIKLINYSPLNASINVRAQEQLLQS